MRKKKNNRKVKNISIVKRVKALKNKIFYARLKSAFESTICFFRNDDQNVVAPAGSGVFIKYKENYYVVTAAHVLAEYYNETFVILHDTELTIGGQLYNTEMPKSGMRADDKIDISILKVDNNSATKLLTRFKALESCSEIATNHNLSNAASYFSVGFPLTKTKKVWGKDEIKSIGFTYQTEPILNYEFKKFGFDSLSTIAIKFDGQVINATNPHPHFSPNLAGMSGSGLWHFYDKGKKALIGIIIEQIKETGHKAVLATKIDIVLKMIDGIK
ncbi:hypothetical protein CLU81_5191 [Flavobacterium sp. 9]|uniref:S1 family peptidase n=1 Tax=Flavobacterium sp. 9 TaxID=2035198 RepID=UPI000C18D475|nr:serine protease [Flavobacterium sp. 9]PIF34536.1 hypothetical protein CLU81_5191 [Flavobacterium sp. 9]